MEAQQFQQLLQIYQKTKNEQALEILVENNTKLIYSLMKRFYNKNAMKEDLFQVGVIGLMKAINHFDLSYQLQFSTYAVPLIIGEMKKYIRDSSPLKVARSLKDLSYAILKETEKYMQDYGKEPSDEMLSHLLQVSKEEILEAKLSNSTVSSLQDTWHHDPNLTLMDSIADKKEDLNQRLDLKNAIDTLSVREQIIIQKRYFVGLSQCELAKILHISQAQVSRIEKNALLKLHNQMSET